MTLFHYFRLFHDIDPAAYQLIRSHCKRMTFAKGDFLLREGEIQKELFFVEQGVQMSYLDTADKQHVMAFTYPPNLSAVPESFLTQTPSALYLESLTDSQVQAISYQTLQHLFDQSRAIERLFRKMTEHILIGILNRHLEFHTLPVAERFKAFARRSPQLLQIVPHKYIASYLRIDPSNFSKLYNSIKI